MHYTTIYWPASGAAGKSENHKSQVQLVKIHPVVELYQSGQKWFKTRMMKTRQQCVLPEAMSPLLWIIRDHRYRPQFQQSSLEVLSKK